MGISILQEQDSVGSKLTTIRILGDLCNGYFFLEKKILKKHCAKATFGKKQMTLLRIFQKVK